MLNTLYWGWLTKPIYIKSGQWMEKISQAKNRVVINITTNSVLHGGKWKVDPDKSQNKLWNINLITMNDFKCGFWVGNQRCYKVS